MGSLTLDNVRKSFGSVDVLKGINLEVAEGEFVVFVGPSGCGKSTLLRIVAGLEEATSGAVRINDRVVNTVPPARRGIAMVFQTYALYPHLNVRDNMGLGLKQAGMPKTEIAQRVDKATAMLSLDALVDRRPAELSGGQRQRVAIGRAIVREPELFLFDEPLSNLDAALRAQTRLEIARLHDQLKATMVYVTHDQVEAMTLADRIVVLDGGVIQQVGSPMELYNDPANMFVAGFIGSPKMNFMSGDLAGRPGVHTLGIRPEHIALAAAALKPSAPILPRPRASDLWLYRLLTQREIMGSDLGVDATKPLPQLIVAVDAAIQRNADVMPDYPALRSLCSALNQPISAFRLRPFDDKREWEVYDEVVDTLSPGLQIGSPAARSELPLDRPGSSDISDRLVAHLTTLERLAERTFLGCHTASIYADGDAHFLIIAHAGESVEIVSWVTPEQTAARKSG